MQAEEISQRQLTELGTQRLGLQLEAGERGGYVVRQVTPGSGASRTGIEPGDFILGINGQALRDDEALRRAVLDLRGRSRALIVVQRGRGRYHVQVPLG